MHRKRPKDSEHEIPETHRREGNIQTTGVKRSAERTSRTHVQLDHLICRKEDNVTITACFTDVQSRLDSNHYPMIATREAQRASRENKQKKSWKVSRRGGLTKNKKNTCRRPRG